MNNSKLETYIELLKAINNKGECRSAGQNAPLKGPDLRRAIDFLVKRKMICRCDEKATYRITERGATVLNYFEPHTTVHFSVCLDNLEVNE